MPVRFAEKIRSVSRRSVWAFPSKPPCPRIRWFKRPLARMAEGRVPEIVREADRLDEIRIDEKIIAQRTVRPALQPVGNRLPDLRHFQRVRQPRAVEVILAAPENLRLVLQAPERRRVQHPVAVDLEWRAIILHRRRRPSAAPCQKPRKSGSTFAGD